MIALAELAGLPRAAQRVEVPDVASPSSREFVLNATKMESAALLWKSICTIDRVVGMMFNLPLGTTAYPFPMPKKIISGGQVIPQNYMCYLANIGTRVQEVDEAYLSGRPETELLEKVFNADQELRSLWKMTPQTWWTLTSESPLPDHMLQYWYHYFTIRSHLQLALRNGSDPQHTYSTLACLKACRAVAIRYVNLRGILPLAFFAGRVLDLQALTATTYLLYHTQRPIAKQGLTVQDESEMPSSELVEPVVQMMESVSSQAGGDFGRQAAAAIRTLRDFLNKPGQTHSQNVTLRIPMLGKINVNRHFKGDQITQQPSQQDMNSTHNFNLQSEQPPLQYDQPDMHKPAFGLSEIGSTDPLSWSMDLMLDDFPPFPDEAFGTDQWLSFDGFNANGQPQGWN